MNQEQLMYEGEGSIRNAPFTAEFAPVTRLIELYRVPETLRAVVAATLAAYRGRERNSGEPKLAR